MEGSDLLKRSPLAQVSRWQRYREDKGIVVGDPYDEVKLTVRLFDWFAKRIPDCSESGDQRAGPTELAVPAPIDG